jgi:hypothetical protein
VQLRVDGRKRGKSSALKTFRRELYGPETICTVPSAGRYSIVDVALGQQARELDERLAGNDDRAVAVDLRVERRSQRELHVGGGERDRAALGGEEIPESTCTVPRVETARETRPSFATSSSLVTLSFIPVPALTSAMAPFSATSAPTASSSMIL